MINNYAARVVRMLFLSRCVRSQIRVEVQEAMDFALSSAEPPMEELYTDIYDAEGYEQCGHTIRGVELSASPTNVKQ